MESRENEEIRGNYKLTGLYGNIVSANDVLLPFASINACLLVCYMHYNQPIVLGSKVFAVLQWDRIIVVQPNDVIHAAFKMDARAQRRNNGRVAGVAGARHGAGHVLAEAATKRLRALRVAQRRLSVRD